MPFTYFRTFRSSKAVFTSDIKKLVRWYGLIQKYAPEILEEVAKPEEKES